jgi:hypothetical protein
MNTERTQLHDYLAHREELARRLTVADRVVRNVESLTLDRAPRGVGRGRMLFAVAAATALLLAGIGLPRVLVHRGSPNSFPAGVPHGVPNKRPPADIPLIWVADPADMHRIIALDHAARPVGWLPVPTVMSAQVIRQSGDGQRVIPGEGVSYELTAQGRRIDLPSGQPYPQTFSDDDRTVCLEQGQVGTPSTLVLVDAEGRVSARYPEAPPDNPSYLSWHTVTCSVRNDVAVLIGSRRLPGGGPESMIRTIRLSSGAEVSRRVYNASNNVPIDASNDGRMVLEVQTGPDSHDTVRNIATGAVLGTLDSTARAMMRNTWAIVASAQAVAGSEAHMVVDVPTGRTVWSATTNRGARVTYPDGSMAMTQEWANGPCPAVETVTITDLATGVTHRSTLDTCPSD